MLVNPMCDELIKVRDQLKNQHISQTNPDNATTLDIPFVVTHDTTNDEIEKVSEHDLLSELKSMFEDRGQIDNVVWDSLSLEDLRDMARIERDAMRDCFSATDDKKDDNTDEYREIISVHDDEDSSDEDTVMGEIEDEESKCEEENEAETFVKNELKKENKKSKTFSFSIGYDTPDADICSSNGRRAIRITMKLAVDIESPLSEEFI